MCAVKDVFSNTIVGYSIDVRMKARLVVAAIEMAAARRGEVPISNTSILKVLRRPVESGQFRSRKVQRALTHYRMAGSMGQVGSAGD